MTYFPTYTLLNLVQNRLGVHWRSGNAKRKGKQHLLYYEHYPTSKRI